MRALRALVVLLLLLVPLATAALPNVERSVTFSGPATVIVGERGTYSGVVYTYSAIGGVAPAGVPVQISFDNVVIATIITGLGGKFSIMLPISAEGAHTFVATAWPGLPLEARSKTHTVNVVTSGLGHAIVGHGFCSGSSCGSVANDSITLGGSGRQELRVSFEGVYYINGAPAAMRRVNTTTAVTVTNGCGDGCTYREQLGAGVYTDATGKYAAHVFATWQDTKTLCSQITVTSRADQDGLSSGTRRSSFTRC